MHTYTTSNIYLRSTYRHCNIYIASYIEEVCTDITTFTEATILAKIFNTKCSFCTK